MQKKPDELGRNSSNFLVAGVVAGLFDIVLAPSALLLEGSARRPWWVPWAAFGLPSASSIILFGLRYYPRRDQEQAVTVRSIFRSSVAIVIFALIIVSIGIYFLEPTRAEILDLPAKGFGIPIALLVAGWFVSDALKEKEIRVKYVELAVNILRDGPKVENSRLRAWTTDVLSDPFSLVPLPEEVK